VLIGVAWIVIGGLSDGQNAIFCYSVADLEVTIIDESDTDDTSLVTSDR